MPTEDIDDILVDFADAPKGDWRLWLHEVEVQTRAAHFVVDAVGDGVADDTAAIQDTIDSAGANADIRLPAGTFKVTSTLIISQNRVNLRGAGMHATKILFAPTGNDTCLQVSNGANIVWQGSITDMTFYSADATYTKVAINLVDTSGYRIDRVTIDGSVAHNGAQYWSGGTGSIGIMTQGRDSLEVNNVSIAADFPIYFGKNPNNSIDSDHFHFSNCFLYAHAKPVVTVQNLGLQITQLLFDGYQAWMLGTDGFQWVDTLSATVSNGLTFKNIRREQQEGTTDYFFRIAHNLACQNITFESCYGPGLQPPSLGGAAGKGVYLRKCEDVSFANHYHSTASEALNIDGTVNRISGRGGNFWQAGSTLVSSGQRMVFGAPKSPNSGALPPTFILDLASNAARDLTVGGGLCEEVITLANDAVAAIGPTGTIGYLTVVTDQGASGEFVLKGLNNVTAEINDVDTVFSAAANTASSINVYWSAGNARYEIQNKRGVTVKVKLLLRGTYSTF